MHDGALWSIPRPRSRAPAWLPGFLETLARMRIDERGELRLLSPHEAPVLPDLLVEGDPGDFYTAWARKVMGTAGH